MERTVPSTASDEIALYLRTIYSLLRTTAEFQISALEETHAATNSSLHLNARLSTPDTSAFIYSLLRLPDSMPDVRSVILGQSAVVFHQNGYPKIETWQQVSARARRRRCFFNGKDTLACYIGSRSDLDDIIPSLVAYQIEWNKLHISLQRWPATLTWRKVEKDPAAFQTLAELLEVSVEDLERLRTIWGREFSATLQRIAHKRCRIGVRLLSGSLADYRLATRAWWDNIERVCPELNDRPVYFISSNTHSLPNLLTGFALRQQEELKQFLNRKGNGDLKAEWENISSGQVPSSLENFWYYILKKYQQTPEGRHLVSGQNAAETASGIVRVPSEHYFDVEAQRVDLKKLNSTWLDPRLNDADHAWLLGERAGYLYRRGGRVVGYGYLGPSAGPFALLDPRDYLAVLAHAEAEAAHRDADFGVEVPLVNRAALDFLLGRGFRMDSFFALFMADVPFGRFDRYLFTSPPFFL